MRTWPASALLALTFALGLAACAPGREAPNAGCPEAPSGLPVTEEELTYLAMLRAHHRAADLWEDRGDLEKASQEMDEALAVERPKGMPSEEAYLDAAARGTRLLLRRQRPDDALALAKKAEKTTTGDSFYLADLKMAEGEAYEAKSAALRAAGSTDDALQEDSQALDAYE